MSRTEALPEPREIGHALAADWVARYRAERERRLNDLTGITPEMEGMARDERFFGPRSLAWGDPARQAAKNRAMSQLLQTMNAMTVAQQETLVTLAWQTMGSDAQRILREAVEHGTVLVDGTRVVPQEEWRLPRICISCGAKTNAHGELPCGH